ncbi:hypothetical protein WJ0W_001901 [Paenibacillus melissococcoides]|uniref:Uncharacterized protein n=1 Tax=Paenibacillus melissococcoides TaxID=2912268 RepID=A0ABM9FZE6_9BACL|nr:hypothetical protein [Paenibacillus dendritiformis]CAH8244671.1 hypothetical protein WJ0W_001901 [Paenibacillus melissococcoides]
MAAVRSCCTQMPYVAAVRVFRTGLRYVDALPAIRSCRREQRIPPPSLPAE